jgi:hypothetical protein
VPNRQIDLKNVASEWTVGVMAFKEREDDMQVAVSVVWPRDLPPSFAKPRKKKSKTAHTLQQTQAKREEDKKKKMRSVNFCCQDSVAASGAVLSSALPPLAPARALPPPNGIALPTQIATAATTATTTTMQQTTAQPAKQPSEEGRNKRPREEVPELRKVTNNPFKVFLLLFLILDFVQAQEVQAPPQQSSQPKISIRLSKWAE